MVGSVDRMGWVAFDLGEVCSRLALPGPCMVVGASLVQPTGQSARLELLVAGVPPKSGDADGPSTGNADVRLAPLWSGAEAGQGEWSRQPGQRPTHQDFGELLNEAELLRLTGKERPAAQVRALKRMGLPCRLECGSVLMSRYHLREWLSGEAPRPSDGPNWDSVR